MQSAECRIVVAGFPWPFFFLLFRRGLRGCVGKSVVLYFVGTRRAVSVCVKDISVLIIKVRLSDVSGRLPLSLLSLRRILVFLELTLRLYF